MGVVRDPRFCATTVCYPTVQGDEFSLDRALVGIGAAGFTCVELVSIPGYCEHFMPERMDSAAASDLRRRVEASGLRLAVANIAADLTTDAGVDRLIRCMCLAPALGIDTLISHIEQTATPDGARSFYERVGRLADAAQRHSIRVGLETHGGLCTTGRDAIDLVKRLGSPFLGVTYDTANVIYWGGVRPEADLVAIEAEVAEHVFHFHLKDKANMTLREYLFPVLGDGIVDFRRLQSVVATSGYSGYLTLEVELDGYPKAPEIVDQALRKSLDYMEAIWR